MAEPDGVRKSHGVSGPTTGWNSERATEMSVTVEEMDSDALPSVVKEAVIASLSWKQRAHALFDAQGFAEDVYADEHKALTNCIFAVTLVMILLSICIFSVESLPKYHQKNLPFFYIVESICIGWFTIELLSRMVTCHSIKRFFREPLNWIDIAAVLPFYLDLIISVLGGGSSSTNVLIILRTIRLTRVFRVFKLSKYNEGIQVVVVALRRSTDALSLLFFLTTITMVLFGSGIFFAEQGAATWNKEKKEWVRKEEYGGPSQHPFRSIPHGFWWCLVTVTTVGYGDMVPVTLPGYLVGVGAMFAGLLIVAFPIIILGSNFTEARSLYFQRKDEEQRMKQYRKQLLVEYVLSGSPQGLDGLRDIINSEVSRQLDEDAIEVNSNDPLPEPGLISQNSIFGRLPRSKHYSYSSGGAISTYTLLLQLNERMRFVESNIQDTVRHAFVQEASRSVRPRPRQSFA